jgi:hypothetical protein
MTDQDVLRDKINRCRRLSEATSDETARREILLLLSEYREALIALIDLETKA